MKNKKTFLTRLPLLFMKKVFLCVAVLSALCVQLRAETMVYTVQLMASIDRRTAEDCAAAMQARGIETFIEQLSDNATTVPWRVRTGRFSDKSDAEACASELKKRGITCWVTTTKSAAVSQDRTQQQTVASVEQQPIAKSAPHTQTAPRPAPLRTYKYFNPNDQAMHVTPSLATIPENLRGRIREIAVYPVWFVSLDTRDMAVTVMVEQKKERVRLAELAAPERLAPPDCVQAFEQTMASALLRLKYDPNRSAPDGALTGMVFLGNGDSLALELVRRGIAVYNPDAVSVLEQQLFKDAEDGARREKACIWVHQEH